jgi:hypothetical protein
MHDIAKDFKFETTMAATYGLRGIGVGLILSSILPYAGSVFRGAGLRSFSISDVPFLLFLWTLGGVVFFAVCDIQIAGGRFSYCRMFVWRTFPLESITSVRQLFGFTAYVEVDHAGKRHRLVFALERRFGEPYPAPVLAFLRVVCRRNAEKRFARL